jgi:hypothetical protein
MRLSLIFLCICFSFNLTGAQTFDEMNQSRKFERQAITDYRANNLSGFLDNIKKSSDLRPNHFRLLYNLAIAYTVNRKNDEALKVLDQLAQMGLSFKIEKEEVFKPLFELEKFKSIQIAMNQNLKPFIHSQKAFSLPDKDLITEGIAYNPKTKIFYISSIHQRKIISVNEKGETRDFSRESDGLWSVSGMRVDSKNQILWVCSSVFPQMQGFKKEDDGKSGIFKYDLKTARLLEKYLLSNETEKHVLGDLILNKKGDVFASDSVSPYLFVIDSDTNKLEIFLKHDSFSSLQGMTLTPDEKTMFVADYSKGIFKLDLATKEFVQLKPAPNVALIGIDGLYLHQGKLIAIQNGTNPNRVIRLSMNPAQTEITGFTTLEANHPNFDEPSLGVLVGQDLYFVANTQWSLVNEKAELQTDKLQNPVILRLKL